MNNKVAKSLEQRIRYLAYQFYAGEDGYFGGMDIKNKGHNLKWEIVDKDTVRFYYPAYESAKANAYVIVNNLSPVKITDTVFHDPKILNKKTTDAYSSVATNNSTDVDMTRTYEISEGRSKSNTIDVGVSVTAGIAQSVGYGGDLYGISGETSFSLDVTASFDAGWEYGSSTDRTVTTEITIPPKTRTTLTATKEVSKLRQSVEYTCELDFTARFVDNGPQHSNITLESMDDLKTIVEGNGYPGLLKGDSDGRYAKRLVAMNGYDWLLSTLKPTLSTYTDKLEFDSAQTGSVILTSYPLSYTIQAGDGFWSAANAMGITSLDVLFKNNPKYNLDYALAGGEVFYAVRR